MKRIRIWADTHSTGVFTDIGEYLNQDETSISDVTWKELQKWVDDYDFIIPMNKEGRKTHHDDITKLDLRGVTLTKQIAREWSKDTLTQEDLYFEYYSEGLLKFLERVSPNMS